MNAFENALKRKIDTEVELREYTPGVVIDVYKNGRRRGLVHAGDTYKWWDLASLTKIIFTASNSIGYFSDHPGELSRPVNEKLGWWRSRATTPALLLSHTAGLGWWKPYYKKLKGPMEPEKRWRQLQRLLAKEKPGRAAKAVYSDLDLWMLGSYLEAARQMSLLEMWESVADRLALKDIFFQPGNRPRFARSKYAPTEKSAWRRGRVMRGEVHDENTWALAGVAPHAGLFGTIEAVSDWGLKLRSAVLKDSKRFGSPAVVRRFVRRQIPSSKGDWGYGFMKPTRGSASCGRYFSADSFGHTGFTGPSLWMDPKQDLLVVIMSNRVHPTRANTSFPKVLRPMLHDWICELL
jgi:CubicO group peptidase (beta-lactamase class C family)